MGRKIVVAMINIAVGLFTAYMFIQYCVKLIFNRL